MSPAFLPPVYVAGDAYHGGAKEIEDDVFHSVSQCVASLKRGGFVKGSAAGEVLLGVKTEYTVGHVFPYFPHCADCEGEADDPDGYEERGDGCPAFFRVYEC